MDLRHQLANDFKFAIVFNRWRCPYPIQIGVNFLLRNSIHQKYHTMIQIIGAQNGILLSTEPLKVCGNCARSSYLEHCNRSIFYISSLKLLYWNFNQILTIIVVEAKGGCFKDESRIFYPPGTFELTQFFILLMSASGNRVYTIDPSTSFLLNGRL